MSHSSVVSTPREVLWAWINRRIKTPWSEDFRAVGSVIDNELRAVVAYNTFVGKTCHMHACIEDVTAVTRPFIDGVFEYPFLQLKLTRVFATIDSINSPSVRLVETLGFSQIFRFKDSGMYGDLLLYELTEERFKSGKFFRGLQRDSNREQERDGREITKSS